MRKTARLTGVLLLAVVHTAVPLMAQSAAEPPRVAVLAAVGVMHPLSDGIRQIYEGAFVPITVEADFRVVWKVFVFGGGQFFNKDGEVVFDVPPAPVEQFPLRLTTASFRAGAGIALPWRQWIFTGAAGFSYTHYSERWTTGEVPTATGHVHGIVAGGGADYRIYRGLCAVGRFEYVYTPVDETRQAVPTFDLSGVIVSGGVAIRF